MKRFKVSKYKSKKSFRRGMKSKSVNYGASPMRGGIRL